MEAIKFEARDDTPYILLDKNSGTFEMSGKSLPEDVIEFYTPVLNWFEAYKSDPLEKTIFDIRLVYFNTSSSKIILDFLLTLEEIKKAGKEVLVRWHSLEEDEDMQEAGEEYAEMVDVNFEFLTYKQ